MNFDIEFPLKPQGEFFTILKISTTILNALSLISLLYLIYYTSVISHKTISVRIIRLIAFYSLFSQFIALGSKFDLFLSSIRLFLGSQMTFLTGNGQSIIWSFCLGLLSYRILSSRSKIDQEHQYKVYQILSGIFMIAYITLFVYLEINPDSLQNLQNLILLYFIPLQLVLPLISIFLYIRQACFVNRVYGKICIGYDIKLKKLILYPCFEFLLFSPSILDSILAVIGRKSAFGDVYFTILSISQSIAGMLQLLIFLRVCNVATITIEKNNENIESEIPSIYREENIRRSLAAALSDE